MADSSSIWYRQSDSIAAPRFRGDWMKCPKCQRTNPADARFCNGCGGELPLGCPNCGRSNPPESLFCNACGHNLSQAPSPAVSEPVSGPATAPSGERRQATVLFSDLSGYTAMNERLDPEEVQGVMSRIKAEAVRIVESYGGSVNQFVGDEELALFGIPTAHKDDPVRAVCATRALHEIAREMSPEVEYRLNQPLRFHSGIHSHGSM